MNTKVYDVKRRTYLYAVDTIKFLDALPNDDVTRTLRRQLLRSATSVGANVTEAQSAGSKRDFANFYRYALKSANESTFWLQLLKDTRPAANGQLEALLTETHELSNILAASLLTMRGRRHL